MGAPAHYRVIVPNNSKDIIESRTAYRSSIAQLAEHRRDHRQPWEDCYPLRTCRTRGHSEKDNGSKESSHRETMKGVDLRHYLRPRCRLHGREGLFPGVLSLALDGDSGQHLGLQAERHHRDSRSCL